MTQERFRKLAAATLVITLGVILWGAFVRATGSGAGCGAHWPMCNGEVLPRAPGTATLIEFTHRLTSGIAFLLVLLQFVWARRAFPSRHPARAGAAASLFFMITEAAVGALLVVFEYVADNASAGRAVWMAVHLINTFLLLGAMTCTFWWARGGAPVRFRGQGSTAVMLVAALVATLLVGVTGAIAALGDTLFTANSLAEGIAQDFSPTAHFLVQLRTLHPVNAALTAAYLLMLRSVIPARRPSPAVRRLANATGAIVVLQIGVGIVNLVLLAPVSLQLVHLLLADALWMSLVLLTAAALASPETAQTPPAGEPMAAFGREAG
ncbi:COX15/CtaA family protein [Chondromyces crocatus]|uniref:Cytochrome oxidase assembly protein n=1 Tax=Chondromyces crocatus TaxID=52 RepID=A0A0K1EME8_CHOCO|nr:COX15/CtaA family protein [Chondromyces crocatus]AKT41996.1 cytochrome oxidase assembly protein [Chondromyces crocatus]